jgi:hypothetical protein
MIPNSNGSNENRAKFLRDSMNPMTPCDGSGSATARAVPDASGRGGDLPMSIRPDMPLTTDPHARGRHSNNISQKPPERSGSSLMAEIHHRLHRRDTRYR